MKVSGGLQIKDVFALAVAAEAGAGLLYSEFRRIFSHVPEAAGFWREMEADERLHENVLREMYDMLSEEEKNAAVDMPLFEEAKIYIGGISVRKILDATFSLDDAYEAAYALEYSEVNAVMQFIVSEIVPQYERHDFILSNLKDHVARLETFSHTLCNEECRRSIMARK
ncbi:MAG: hypothetical protein M0Z60_05055 [Nitrospiraceae bacterium]|nr:hypothetical protein [Nitrospiraceae bacterium]